MANITINSLPTASTIDATQDILPIYTASGAATQGINRNTLLGLTSAPVGLTDSQTLTSKVLTSPTINGATLSGTLSGTYTIGGTPTFPASVVTLTGSQTLTNKVLTSPTINSPTITNATISADTVTGFSSSTTGTVYGVSVASGVIASAALLNSVNTAAIQSSAVTTAKIAAANITAALLQFGTIRQRQGGTTGDGSWATVGTSNTDTSAKNVFIQVGSANSSASVDVTVTFPVAFTQVPVIFAQCQTNIGLVQTSSITTTNFVINCYTTAGSRQALANSWIAIGQ